MSKSEIQKKLLPKYSGRYSHKFWDKINKLKGVEHTVLYSAGVFLQDAEHLILDKLNKERS